MSIYLTAQTAMGVVAALLVNFIIKAIGKKATYVLSCLMYGGTAMLMYFIGGEGMTMVFIVVMSIGSFFNNCIRATITAMTADTVIYSMWKSGTNARGFIMSMTKHECGMYYEHHSCGMIRDLVPELVGLGIDALNPVQLQNDPKHLKDVFGDRLTLSGGFDNQGCIDRPDATEEEIRASLRKTLEVMAPGGKWIARTSFINKGRDQIWLDVLDEYNRPLKEKYGVEAVRHTASGKADCEYPLDMLFCVDFLYKNSCLLMNLNKITLTLIGKKSNIYSKT